MENSQLERLVVEHAENTRNRFYGKYRGIVKDINDEDNMGRIRALVPEVLGDVLCWWAVPCVPFAGKDHGFVVLPEENDGVWIEFEAGDPARPIWSGGWWGTGEMQKLGDKKIRAWVTTAGHKFTIDDDKNIITIKHKSGSMVEIKEKEMTLKAASGEVVLSSSGVAINGTALTVKK